jgi:hypothetical protein
MPVSELQALVEETDNLSSDMLSPGFFVVHDTSTCGEHNVSELTRGEKLYDPLLKIAELDIVARADAASLVDAKRC